MRLLRTQCVAQIGNAWLLLFGDLRLLNFRKSRGACTFCAISVIDLWKRHENFDFFVCFCGEFSTASSISDEEEELLLLTIIFSSMGAFLLALHQMDMRMFPSGPGVRQTFGIPGHAWRQSIEKCSALFPACSYSKWQLLVDVYYPVLQNIVNTSWLACTCSRESFDLFVWLTTKDPHWFMYKDVLKPFIKYV